MFPLEASYATEINRARLIGTLIRARFSSLDLADAITLRDLTLDTRFMNLAYFGLAGLVLALIGVGVALVGEADPAYRLAAMALAALGVYVALNHGFAARSSAKRRIDELFSNNPTHWGNIKTGLQECVLEAYSCGRTVLNEDQRRDILYQEGLL